MTTDTEREFAVCDRLCEIGAQDRTVIHPDRIGLEVRSNPQVWETVYAIALRADGSCWVRTHNYTYRSIPTWDLRVTAEGAAK